MFVISNDACSVNSLHAYASGMTLISGDSSGHLKLWDISSARCYEKKDFGGVLLPPHPTSKQLMRSQQQQGLDKPTHSQQLPLTHERKAAAQEPIYTFLNDDHNMPISHISATGMKFGLLAIVCRAV